MCTKLISTTKILIFLVENLYMSMILIDSILDEKYQTFYNVTRKSIVNISSLGTTTVPSVYLHVHLFHDFKWNNQTVVSRYEKSGKLLPRPRVFFS